MVDYAGSEITFVDEYNTAPDYQTDFGPSGGSVYTLTDNFSTGGSSPVRTVPLLVRTVP